MANTKTSNAVDDSRRPQLDVGYTHSISCIAPSWARKRSAVSESCQKQLPMAGSNVARDGEEALEYLAACEASAGSGHGDAGMPKVMLLDLKLPKVDGHEVLRQTKDNPATKIIPVVVRTCSDQHEDMLKAYLMRVNSYIQKPVKFDEFWKLVNDLGSYWLVVNQVPSPQLND